MANPYIRRNQHNFDDAYDGTHFSQKHYRPHHRNINKRRLFFTSESTVYDINLGESYKEVSINKELALVNNVCGFDMWKDGSDY